MKMNWLTRIAFAVLVLALVVPTAAAGKGGTKGGGNGGGGNDGGGEDPAPTCSGHVYTLWQVFDGIASSENGLARVCLDGADGEQITADTLSWRGRLEVSPDGTHVLHNDFDGAMVAVDNPTNVQAFTGDAGDLPLGAYPSFSWRVDSAGDPLGVADQYVAAARDDPLVTDYDNSTFQSHDIYAFHPTAGATATRLTTLPRVYTRTAADVVDQDSGQTVPGFEVNVVHTLVRHVTWIAGTAANPEVSWIVFHQKTTDETWDVVEDTVGARYWSTSKTETQGWSVMAVQTSDTGVSVLHAPRSLVAAGDEGDVDIRDADLHNFRVSKFGTHALWEYAEASGLRRAALTYSSSDASLPPTVDVSTIESIDSTLFSTVGSVPFSNVGLSHDGSRLAVALGEVWTMDIDTGASSLEQISENIRKRKPGYGFAVAWDQ